MMAYNASNGDCLSCLEISCVIHSMPGRVHTGSDMLKWMIKPLLSQIVNMYEIIVPKAFFTVTE